MKGLKRSIVSVLLVILMISGLCVPHTTVEAASVKVVYSGKTKTYSKKKASIIVNGKKTSLSKEPIFMKSGSYMGPASKIFKKSSLEVGYKESSSHKTLTLTYNNHVLKMTSGSKNALLDGEKTSFGTAPMYGKYKSSGYKRWIIPLKSVCSRLGINYKLGSDGVIRLTGNTNGTTLSAPDPQTTPEPNPDGKVVIVLDAGHGGKDSGAVSNDKAEKNLTLEILLGAKKYFDNDGRFKVYYTRTSDTYPSLTDRSDLANNMNADFFISIHINSADSTSAEGSETLYNPKRNSETKKNGMNSHDLADAMQQILVYSTGFKNRGLKERTDLSVLNKTKMPACLMEFGFISNKKERVSMTANATRYGKDIYDGLVAYMKNIKKIQ